jgi:hypothetical protein
MRLAALAVLALAAPAFAQPPIPAAATDAPAGDGPFAPPAKLVPKSGVAVYVPPATVVSAVYFGLDGEEPFDASAIGGSKTAFVLFVRGLTPGKTYRFKGVGSDKAGVLTVADFDVTVPGPPVPPTPPTPPVNPYRAALKAAFDADPGEPADKLAVRKSLAELYDLAATMALAPFGDQLHVTTTDQLRTRLRAAAASLAQDQCAGLRTAIANILAPALPLGQPLTGESRRAAAGLFRQVSEGLSW